MLKKICRDRKVVLKKQNHREQKHFYDIHMENIDFVYFLDMKEKERITLNYQAVYIIVIELTFNTIYRLPKSNKFQIAQEARL